MKKSEINATIKSACNDAIEFMEAFAANEFSMRGLPRTLIKPMKNETVIDKLNITEAEMKAMRTIIDATVKRERNTESKRNKRRKTGIKERQEYLAEQKENTESKLWELEMALERVPNATQRQLAEYLKWSVGYVNKMLKKLK
jgi:hypothetical protein